jgi:hypothetical protein
LSHFFSLYLSGHWCSMSIQQMFPRRSISGQKRKNRGLSGGSIQVVIAYTYQWMSKVATLPVLINPRCVEISILVNASGTQQRIGMYNTLDERLVKCYRRNLSLASFPPRIFPRCRFLFLRGGRGEEREMHHPHNQYEVDAHYSKRSLFNRKTGLIYQRKSVALPGDCTVLGS